MITYKYCIICTTKPLKVGQVFDVQNTPHITIKRRFKFIRGNKVGKSLYQLRTEVKSLLPFNFKLGNKKEFPNKVNYLEVKNIKQLKKIHCKIVTLLKSTTITKNPEFELIGFIPHLTISDEIIRSKNKMIGREFAVKELYFIKEQRRHYWLVLDKLN